MGAGGRRTEQAPKPRSCVAPEAETLGKTVPARDARGASPFYADALMYVSLGPRGLLGVIILPLATGTRNSLASPHGSSVTSCGFPRDLSCSQASVLAEAGTCTGNVPSQSPSFRASNVTLPSSPPPLKKIPTLPMCVLKHRELCFSSTHRSHSFIQRKSTG